MIIAVVLGSLFCLVVFLLVQRYVSLKRLKDLLHDPSISPLNFRMNDGRPKRIIGPHKDFVVGIGLFQRGFKQYLVVELFKPPKQAYNIRLYKPNHRIQIRDAKGKKGLWIGQKRAFPVGEAFDFRWFDTLFEIVSIIPDEKE